MDTQLEELLTGYGPLGGIWFDGMWDKPGADWRLARTYALIHRLQPAALIIPNHHQAPLPGEDVQTFEQDLPGANSAGFNTKEIGALPLETSLTMNNSWGFNIFDDKFKTVPELIGYLVRAAGHGANLLLNIGPRPDGTIQPEAAERLRAMGLARDLRRVDLRHPRPGRYRRGRGGPRPGAETRSTSTCSTGRIACSRCPTRRAGDTASMLAGGADRPLHTDSGGVTLTPPTRARRRAGSRGHAGAGVRRKRDHDVVGCPDPRAPRRRVRAGGLHARRPAGGR